MKKILFFTGIMSLFFLSCRNDFDVNSEWKDISVVYCLLNQNDSIHYIRLSRAFLGEEDAAVMSKISDSLHYTEAEVRLELWREGYEEPSKTIILDTTTSVPKKPNGYFASDHHFLYFTKEKLTTDGYYKLNIYIPSKNKYVASETRLIKNLTISKPTTNPLEKISLSNYSSSYSCSWQSTAHAKIYEMKVIFYYLEIENNVTSEKIVEWTFPSRISQTVDGGEEMKQELTGLDFYKLIGSSIPYKEGVQRIVRRKAFDFIFYVGNEDLNTYIEVNKPVSGIVQEKPVFTNIENGIGLFAARYNKTISGKELSEKTIDSIASGIYTKKLKFCDFNQSVIYWSQHP